MKQSEDRKTRELPLAKTGPKPLLGRRMTAAERQERRRLLRAASIVDRLDDADRALLLVRHEVTRTTPDLQMGLAIIEAQLAALRKLCANS